MGAVAQEAPPLAMQEDAAGLDGQDGFCISARAWHKPIQFDVIGTFMTRMWGTTPAKAVVASIRAYLVTRRLMELHKMSTKASEAFDLQNCEVHGGYMDMGDLVQFVRTQNPHASYKCVSHIVPLPVSFLNSCLLLNVHSVDSVRDHVQIMTRKNILSCEAEDGVVHSVCHWRAIFRGVLLVHATRHYEPIT